jgi:hypothetical protein
VTLGCPNCAAVVNDRGLRKELGIDWLCARCGAAGTHTRCDVGGRVVAVREQTVPGNPELRRPWVPAESMPYAERVRPIATEG